VAVAVAMLLLYVCVIRLTGSGSKATVDTFNDIGPVGDTYGDVYEELGPPTT